MGSFPYLLKSDWEKRIITFLKYHKNTIACQKLGKHEIFGAFFLLQFLDSNPKKKNENKLSLFIKNLKRSNNEKFQ